MKLILYKLSHTTM